MGRERHSEEKIIYALKQADAGTSVKEICRQMGYLCLRSISGSVNFRGSESQRFAA
jgi:hypothetical protein